MLARAAAVPVPDPDSDDELELEPRTGLRGVCPEAAARCPPRITLLSGEPLKIDGLDLARNVAQAKVLVASALGRLPRMVQLIHLGSTVPDDCTLEEFCDQELAVLIALRSGDRPVWQWHARHGW